MASDTLCTEDSVKLATWNIYWLGDRAGNQIRRTDEDENLIARVIAHISPDILAVQEVVDPKALERILNIANAESGRDYIIRDGDTWFTSDSRPTSETSHWQKVFIGIDRNTIEFIRGAAIRGTRGRKPYAAELQHRNSGHEVAAVVVHFQSGYPVFLDEEDAQKRRRQARSLARWLQGDAEDKNPDLPRPASSQIVVLGDFNAELNDPNESLLPLQEGSSTDWSWEVPQDDAGHNATAIDDGYIIDFIMFSPTMAPLVEDGPRIYAWDHDPAFGGATAFHTGADGSGRLRSYGVSDHRPVTCTLRQIES